MSGVLEFSLRRAGYDVFVCPSGRRAIAAVEGQQFDFIVTDFQMPEANGDQVIRAARTSTLNASTPIILCSAKGLEIDAEALLREYDLAAVVSKPFSPREVTSLISSVDKQVARRTQTCC